MPIKLSICIPTYNRSFYLERLLNVLYEIIPREVSKFIEIVISDNHSQDETEVICSKFSQKFLNFSYHKNNKNIGGGPNAAKVAEYARGKYIWSIGDDDLIDANSFLAVYDEILAACNENDFGLLVLNTKPLHLKDKDIYARFNLKLPPRELYYDLNKAINSIQDNIQWMSCQVVNRELRAFGCADAAARGFNDPHVYGAMYAISKKPTILRRDVFIYAGGEVPYDFENEPPEVKNALKLTRNEHPWIAVFFDTQTNAIKYSPEYGFDIEKINEFRWRIDRQLVRVFGTHKFTGVPDNSNVPLKRFLDLLSFSSSRLIFLMIYYCPLPIWKFGYGLYRTVKRLLGINAHT